MAPSRNSRSASCQVKGLLATLETAALDEVLAELHADKVRQLKSRRKRRKVPNRALAGFGVGASLTRASTEHQSRDMALMTTSTFLWLLGLMHSATAFVAPLATRATTRAPHPACCWVDDQHAQEIAAAATSIDVSAHKQT